MRIFIFLVLLLIHFSFVTIAQEQDPWTMVWDKKKDLIGYKDKHGQIKIPPRFLGFTSAKTFRNIISVMEQITEDSISNYYLLKTGKKVGIDSTFMWDMYFDCEQENKIRFRDKKSDFVGFFDHQGNVAIPALYSDARPFYNGLAVVLIGAKRMCENGLEFSPSNRCEHWRWMGGKTQLINSKNDVLLDSLNWETISGIDWYSLKVTESELSDRINFAGTDGKFYSFINLENEFKDWLYNNFYSKINSGERDIKNYLNDEIFVEVESKKSRWRKVNPSGFEKKYQPQLVSLLKPLTNNPENVNILSSNLNPFIFNTSTFEPYYNDCGEHIFEKFPLYTVVIDYQKNNESYQNHFEFLRTAKGYRLIKMSISDLGD